MKQRGQTLLEVLAALGAGIVILIAITSAVLSSLSNAQFSKNQNLATLYAQQGMEMMRDLRNKDWNSFASRNGSFCLLPSGILVSGLCGTADYIDGIFKRAVVFETVSSGKRVTVTVSFTDSKGEHKSELISVFTNWRQ